jgi:nanoRNase/pAp phosphatase (c-di-AMP/oligoRNAs hydrolase)
MNSAPDGYINPINRDQLDTLHSVLGTGPVLILTHDNPDPDSLASGKGLAFLFGQEWNIHSRLVYSGLVARAENRAVLNLLTPEWEIADSFPDLDAFSAVVLVDTQPSAGNNFLPASVIPQVVIDHHYPRREALRPVQYVDVRPEIGSTVTMIFQYLDAAGLVPDTNLSTAMFYGLQTDTRGLARGVSRADEEIYLRLLGLIDRAKLVQVEQAGLSRDYFRAFSQGLSAARVFGHSVISYLDNMHRPDFAAEMADVLIRLENARAVLCLGKYKDQIVISLRTEPSGQDAGLLVQQVVEALGTAGGHGTMAGGQVPLANRDAGQVVEELQRRFLGIMRELGEGKPLLGG